MFHKLSYISIVALTSTNQHTSVNTVAEVHNISNGKVEARANGSDVGNIGDEDRESDECSTHVCFGMRL